MGALEGGTLPEKRAGRETLTVCDPQVKSALASFNFTDFEIGETTRWGNSLAAAVRRFKAGREAIQGDRRISKREAENIWRQQVVRRPNTLAARWKGGAK